jgi:hypothetical protein
MRIGTTAVVALTVVLSCLRTEAAQEKSMGLTVLSSMERISQHQTPFGVNTADLCAARNEGESFQVVVAALNGNIRVMAANLSDFVGPKGAKIASSQTRLYREEYVRVRRSTPGAELPPGLYPDPLVPFLEPVTGKPIEPLNHHQQRWGESTATRGHDMFALPFDVFKGQNQPIWIDVHVPKDATAGEYRATFHVTADDGAAEIPVTLTVWDFTLPDGPTHRNHFGGFDNIVRDFATKPDSEQCRAIEARYCQALAEHRINPPIPRHLLPEVKPDGSLNIVPERHKALQQFIADLHVTDFQVPNAPFAQLPTSTLRPDYKQIAPDQREKAQRYYHAYFDYLKQNGWEKRAYVYLWDEPNMRENYEQVLVLGQLVHEAAPGLKCLVVEQTYSQDPSWPDIDPAVDIWCPLWSFIDRESVRKRLAEGDEVWSYTALTQLAPPYHPQYQQVKDKNPPHWHIDRPLLVYRVPTWINRQYGITGLLYWSTVTPVIAPWFNPAFNYPQHDNGGGFLLYPGTPCGIDGPIASMRLKNIRDGMEDYEYFALLEKVAGSESVQKIVDRIAPNWWDYSRDPGMILAVRREMARQIAERKQAGP